MIKPHADRSAPSLSEKQNITAPPRRSRRRGLSMSMRSAARPLAIIMLGVLLVGCASRAVGVMKPVGAVKAANASEVNLLAATTRAPPKINRSCSAASAERVC